MSGDVRTAVSGGDVCEVAGCWHEAGTRVRGVERVARHVVGVIVD